MNNPRSHIILSLVMVASCIGCSGDRSVTGGTQGTLRNSRTPLREVQIHVYRANNPQPIGFGVSDATGRFELYQPGATGPLYLEPGEYAFTLEALGPDDIPLAAETGEVQRTPLRIRWPTSQKEIELVIP